MILGRHVWRCGVCGIAKGHFPLPRWNEYHEMRVVVALDLFGAMISRHA
jgi:hypothetical protein